MSKVLHIISSPRSQRSKSIDLADKIIEKRNLNVDILNVNDFEIPFVTNGVVNCFFGYTQYQDLSDADKKIVDLSNKFIDQLKQYDELIISTPMWNFWFPAILKAYFDLVTRFWVTFNVIDGNYVALLDNIKKVTISLSSWWDFRDDSMSNFNVVTQHMWILVNFIIPEPDFNLYQIHWANMYEQEKIDQQVNEILASI